MEIRHLRYFIAVAEQRNFTRGKRGAELTPAGELLLPHARRLVADEAWRRAS